MELQKPVAIPADSLAVRFIRVDFRSFADK
jgi:hypothetical protein